MEGKMIDRELIDIIVLVSLVPAGTLLFAWIYQKKDRNVFSAFLSIAAVVALYNLSIFILEKFTVVDITYRSFWTYITTALFIIFISVYESESIKNFSVKYFVSLILILIASIIWLPLNYIVSIGSALLVGLIGIGMYFGIKKLINKK